MAPQVAAAPANPNPNPNPNQVLPWHLKWVSPLLELLPLGVRDAVLDLVRVKGGSGANSDSPSLNPDPKPMTLTLTPLA